MNDAPLPASQKSDTPIEQCAIARPQYTRAETLDAWLQLNSELVFNYWCALERAKNADPERPGAYAALMGFAVTQFEDCAMTAQPAAQVQP